MIITSHTGPCSQLMRSGEAFRRRWDSVLRRDGLMAYKPRADGLMAYAVRSSSVLVESRSSSQVASLAEMLARKNPTTTTTQEDESK